MSHMIIAAEVIATVNFIRHHIQCGHTDYYRDFEPKTGKLKWWSPNEQILVTHLLHMHLEEEFVTKRRLGIFHSNQISS